MALVNLSSKSAENKAHIVSSGGLEHIFAAMAAHMDVPVVQKCGCWALANLSANNDGNQTRIVSSGDGS